MSSVAELCGMTTPHGLPRIACGEINYDSSAFGGNLELDKKKRSFDGFYGKSDIGVFVRRFSMPAPFRLHLACVSQL